jgi:hypothetical protein
MNRRFFTLGLGGLASASQVPQTAMGQPAGQPVMLDASALILANPELSRFRPLRRILFYDDFDDGINGWVELQANHNGNLDDLRPGFNDMRPPQLSSCTFFDVGTHGSLNGTYSLKLATRPKPFHSAAALKRFTYAQPCRVQLEMWFTYKPEQTFDGDTHWNGNASPAEQNFGDFTMNTDICGGVGGPRYMLALRYANTDLEGKMVQKWMYSTSLETTTKEHREGHGATQTLDHHVHNVNDWADVPGGHQPLCFNEMPTKINWHYLRWVFDLRTRKHEELQANELTMDLRDIPVLTFDQKYYALNHLLNVAIDVRTHKAVRNFLFIDSVLISEDA